MGLMKQLRLILYDYVSFGAGLLIGSMFVAIAVQSFKTVLH